MGECSVEGCRKPARCRGWCSAHYERWRRNGEPGPAGDARRRPPRTCSVNGCDKRPVGRGWCTKHWARWKKFGDPLATKRPNYGSGRSTSMRSGYVRIWAPEHPAAMSDGYVFEHRMVLHDAGVDIAGKHVHHKNGDKADNDETNLSAVTNSEHHGEHHPVGSLVRNQYGYWPIG